MRAMVSREDAKQPFVGTMDMSEPIRFENKSANQNQPNLWLTSLNLVS